MLIIDDTPSIHNDFRKILGPSPLDDHSLNSIEDALFGERASAPVATCFELDSARQGQEGIDCVRRASETQRPYALAFVDVRMPPGMDGIETAAELWKIDPDLQVVICTAYSDYSWTDMRARLGASDKFILLKKPFDNIEVTQIAESLSAKWQLLQASKRKLRELEAIAEERTAELSSTNFTLRKEIEERHRSEIERRALEIQLRQAQKLEAIGQLAAGIAHEINTPTQYVGDNVHFLEESCQSLLKLSQSHRDLLRAAARKELTPEILDASQRLLEESDLDYLSKELPSAFAATLDGVERISKIVRAMKEFSHPGSTEKSLTDINRAVETTVTVARNEWKYVAEVRLELAENLPHVPCLAGELNQSILNLIINAAHAIGDVVKNKPETRGTITVSTRLLDASVEIAVQDTGAGIPEAIRSRIFEPFFTTKEVGKGSGQGLAMIYTSIVKKHGGAVRFDSEVGRGTTFYLTLPLSPAAPLLSDNTTAA